MADLAAVNIKKDKKEVCVRCRNLFLLNSTGEYINNRRCSYHDKYNRITGTLLILIET